MATKAFNKATNSKLVEDWDAHKVQLKEYKKVVRQRPGEHASGKLKTFRKQHGSNKFSQKILTVMSINSKSRMIPD